MLLFLSDNYYPSWGVKIDGKTTPLLKADTSFRAVAIEKGVHIVEFYYDHRYFTMGMIISLFGIAFYLTYILYITRYAKKT